MSGTGVARLMEQGHNDLAASFEPFTVATDHQITIAGRKLSDQAGTSRLRLSQPDDRPVSSHTSSGFQADEDKFLAAMIRWDPAGDPGLDLGPGHRSPAAQSCEQGQHQLFENEPGG